MDMNPKVTDVEHELFQKITPLKRKHIFTKTLGDGEINIVTRKNDLSGLFVYFHSNLHGEIKLDGNEFLDEVDEVKEIDQEEKSAHKKVMDKAMNSFLYDLFIMKQKHGHLIDSMEYLSTMFSEFYNLVDKKKFVEASVILQDITDVLGENNTEVLRARTTLEFERDF